MKFVDEYRDPAVAGAWLERIQATVTRPWTVMEVCGGQTHSILRHGLDTLLPAGVTLLHGPGCPVCVTPVELIDAAIALARRPEVTLCSFGDMLRVPGSREDLLQARAAGADVRAVYAPDDAVRLAERLPERQVVFFAVGFETTAPATALAVREARAQGLGNFSLLSAHVRVPPALDAVLGAADAQVQGLLAPGHVCAVMGWAEYEPVAARYRVPIVVTGFEPVDILQGLALCLRQLEQGRAEVENQYRRAVRREGNPAARALLEAVYVPVARRWRGLGVLPASGLALAPAWAEFDALRRFDLPLDAIPEAPDCLAGAVLQGRLRPPDCPQFGRACTPERPLGATMVSSEGACAAYYRYARARAAAGA